MCIGLQNQKLFCKQYKSEPAAEISISHGYLNFRLSEHHGLVKRLASGWLMLPPLKGDGWSCGKALDCRPEDENCVPWSNEVLVDISNEPIATMFYIHVAVSSIKVRFTSKTTEALRSKEIAEVYPDECAFSILFRVEEFEAMDLIAT
ncbi:hypothetical protein Btru_056264 [Bulinus truncatus]|nr:hypothetical protein Btru_056264 [Bulinus truncatus]